jgi:hypothetical protein
MIAVFIFYALRISNLIHLRLLPSKWTNMVWTVNDMQKWSGECMWAGNEQLLLLAHANCTHENVRVACMQKHMRRIPANHKKIGEDLCDTSSTFWTGLRISCDTLCESGRINHNPFSEFRSKSCTFQGTRLTYTRKVSKNDQRKYIKWS